MNLFMVLIVAGQVSGTWGPLPYDMGECLSRQVEMQEEFAQHDRTKEWKAVCEWHTKRPQLGEKR